MKHVRNLMALVALASILGAGALAASAQQPVNLAFSTLGQGTAWYIYGATPRCPWRGMDSTHFSW